MTDIPATDIPAPAADPASVWTPEGERHPPPSQDALIAAIGTVYDPEIPVNVYELGLIYAIEIDGDRVGIDMTLTAPNCPSAQELPQQVQEAVQAVPGVGAATVTIVWDPPWDQSRMSDEARLMLNMY